MAQGNIKTLRSSSLRATSQPKKTHWESTGRLRLSFKNHVKRVLSKNRKLVSKKSWGHDTQEQSAITWSWTLLEIELKKMSSSNDSEQKAERQGACCKLNLDHCLWSSHSCYRQWARMHTRIHASTSLESKKSKRNKSGGR